MLIVLMLNVLVPRLDVAVMLTTAGVAVVLIPEFVGLLAETVRVPANPLIPVRIIVELTEVPA